MLKHRGNKPVLNVSISTVHPMSNTQSKCILYCWPYTSSMYLWKRSDWYWFLHTRLLPIDVLTIASWCAFFNVISSGLAISSMMPRVIWSMYEVLIQDFIFIFLKNREWQTVFHIGKIKMSSEKNDQDGKGASWIIEPLRQNMSWQDASSTCINVPHLVCMKLLKLQ